MDEKYNIKQEYFEFCFSKQDLKLSKQWINGKKFPNKQGHHIYPKSLFPDLSPFVCNIVILDTNDHIEAHRMLAEMTKETGMISAYNWMSGHKLEINGDWTCESTKCKLSAAGKKQKRTPEQLRKFSEKRKGHLVSKETRDKISSALKGRIPDNIDILHSKESKDKARKLSREKSQTQEFRNKQSKNTKGRIYVNNGFICKMIYPNEIPEGFIRGRIGMKNQKQQK
jgi:hypothetical protein